MAIDASTELPVVDPQVWHACAGPAAKLPAVRSTVYYFPQGHAEQASSPPNFPAAAGSGRSPFFLCRTASVGLHVDPETDEVFARILLDPRPAPPPPLSLEPPSSLVEQPDDGGAAAFVKVLTPSDANNGGGFSVPRFCADSIFPPLDMAAEPPVQNVTIRDVHGKMWTFRHIFRGTPRRHLLTTGWSKFVNAKKLIAGDSVVFIKNRDGLFYMGIRRASRSYAGGPQDYFRYTPRAAPPPTTSAAPAATEASSEVNRVTGGGFSRNSCGRIPAEDVVEAARLAEMGRPFEVVHYPRASAADFVVAVEKVNASLRVPWTAGMRVRMSVATEELSRTTVFRGTVSGTTVQDQARWPLSPWRILQVTWDEAEVLQNIRSVSPWQVELDSATAQMQIPISDSKKPRLLQYPNLFMNAEERMLFPMTGKTNTMMASIAPSPFSYNMFPASMQGARHNSISVTNLLNSAPSEAHNLYLDHQCSNGMQQKTAEISEELNVMSTPQSEILSPPSQGSIHLQGMDLPATAVRNPNKENIRPPLQLFGQFIDVDRSPETDAGKGYKETKCQRISAVEGCFP